MNQPAGRPKIEIDVEEIHRLVNLGFNNTQIANRIGVHRQTLLRWMKENNFYKPGNNDFTNDEIDYEVQKIKSAHILWTISNHHRGHNSFIYGPSKFITRIERFIERSLYCGY